LYEFGVLLEVFFTFVCSVVIAASHALSRPVINEIYYLHQAKTQEQQRRLSVVPEERTGGEEDDEDELTFTQVDMFDQNRNLRSRKSATCIQLDGIKTREQGHA